MAGPEQGDGRRELSAGWRVALTVTTAGWNLGLPIAGGVVLGHLLDQRLGTGYQFTIGLLLGGIATGYYTLVKFIQRIDDLDQRPQSEEKPIINRLNDGGLKT